MKLTQEDQGDSAHVYRVDSTMQKRFPISAATLIAIPLMMAGGVANADQGIHRGQDKEQFRKSVTEFYNWTPQVRAADCPVGKHWATAPGGGIAQCVANPVAPSGGFFSGLGGSDSGSGGGFYYVSDGGDTSGPGDAPSSPGSAPGSCGPGTAGTCDAASASAAADAGASSDAGDAGAGDGSGGDAGGGDSGGGDGGGGDGGGW